MKRYKFSHTVCIFALVFARWVTYLCHPLLPKCLKYMCKRFILVGNIHLVYNFA
jgi:hypothetical protein